MSLQRLFVYGTLKKGQNNHHFLKHSNFETSDVIEKTDMYDLGGFPGVVKGKNKVHVESYIVNEKTLQEIDRLEGHPYFYNRQIIRSSSGKKGWIYIFLRDKYLKKENLLTNGIW
jgi:gamma-glutamylcyclotransferase (GGCT)/AIG2-like uncharacterized protein YtfP